MPGRTGVNMNADTQVRLSRIGNVAGVKEASGDLAQIARIMRESVMRFNHTATARSYFEIYESMLKRPLVNAF